MRNGKRGKEAVGMGIIVDVLDFSSDILDYVEEDALTALEECGQIAEGYAKRLCPVDTGNLRNSITHTVVSSKKAAYVGSPVDYAA